MYKEYRRLIREWSSLGNKEMVWKLAYLIGWCDELDSLYDVIKLEHVLADVMDQ